MPGDLPNAKQERFRGLLLAIDTCGPSGSVALGRAAGAEILRQIELEGRSYSSTLVAAVGELLGGAGVGLQDIGAIVAVSGPGSFTGVRVGLAAVKGLAEARQIPVVAVSRLAVLAHRVGIASAALDAHRHEVFLRIGEPQSESRELLAGAPELAALAPPPRIAVCDEAAAALLSAAWPATEIVPTAAPSAADALRLALPRVMVGAFVDLVLLDGHYLRRSDAEIFGAEIFGEPGGRAAPMNAPAQAADLRPMTAADLSRVMEIVASLHHAPHWPLPAYVDALDPERTPRRIALVAVEPHSQAVLGFAVASLLAPQSELESIAVAKDSQRRGLARQLFAGLVRNLASQEISEVILEVRASNHPALQLYRALGFAETARRARYYADPVEDAILLSLRIA
jgi:tRNA threonylcarbamoyl adenosine modification protein YeaZ/ribosomal-protein-alanine acetyltransferase